MEHSKLNRIIAAVVFAIAFIVYGKTVAPTTSYWDCGEFITCSYILGVPHPPGAPLYILIGRIFSMIPFVEDIGLRINMISVILSAVTVMLVYLIIVQLLKAWKGIPQTIEEKMVIYGSGIIGALGFALTDSFWFNAVEAEVYAVSMFFTAIVVWLILAWEEKAEDPASDKILLLIAYLIGLAIGVHLLNILAIPTLFLIVYFRRAELNFATFVTWGLAAAAMFGVIYPVLVQGIPYIIEKYSFWALGLVVAVLFAATVYCIMGHKRVLSLMLMGIMLIAVGYSAYTAIYIRSGLKPVINENHPDTPEKLVSYLNREQYGDIPITERRAPMWEYQVKKMYLRYFGWQFIGQGTTYGEDGFIVETISLKGLWALPFLVGMIGMIYHFRKDWKRASAIAILFIMTGVAITLYLNQEDPQPRDRDYAYIGSFFAFAIWMGMGAAGLIETICAGIKDRSLLRKLIYILTPALILLVFAQALKPAPGTTSAFYDFIYNLGLMLTLLGGLFVLISLVEWVVFTLKARGVIKENYHLVPLFILLLLVPVNLFTNNFETHDRTGNYVAYDYSYNILQSCEENAILFTNGDNDTFPLWFLQYVYGVRTDVRVVNLSLLNTPWYIKQLRDEAPKVPILLNDATIDALQARLWEKPKHFEIKVERDVILAELSKAKDNAGLKPEEVPENPKVAFQLANTKVISGHPVILVQDLMVFHIIQANQFRQPVYFAVTVAGSNMLGLENRRGRRDQKNYLRMDGLVFKVMPYGGPPDFISQQRLEENLFTRFQYRNLDNPDVYFNPNIQGLLQNYRSAFLRLTNYFQTDAKDKNKAVAVLDKMEEVMPEKVIPLRNYQLSLSFGRLYKEVGRPDELERRLDNILAADDLQPLDKVYIAQAYFLELGEEAKAESLAKSVLTKDPDLVQTYSWLVSFYSQKRQFNKAVEVLQKWVDRNPDDPNAVKQLEDLKTLASLDSSGKIEPDTAGSKN